jgi:hypothetical protein
MTVIIQRESGGAFECKAGNVNVYTILPALPRLKGKGLENILYVARKLIKPNWM